MLWLPPGRAASKHSIPEHSMQAGKHLSIARNQKELVDTTRVVLSVCLIFSRVVLPISMLGTANLAQACVVKFDKLVCMLQTEIVQRLSGGAQSGRAAAAEKALEKIKEEGTLVEKPFVARKRTFA